MIEIKDENYALIGFSVGYSVWIRGYPQAVTNLLYPMKGGDAYCIQVNKIYGSYHQELKEFRAGSRSSKGN